MVHLMRLCTVVDFIYDFETLSKDRYHGVVVNVATLDFDEKRFVNNPYTFSELVSNCKIFKFDIMEQKEKFGRTIDPDTFAWWKSQPMAAQMQLKPSAEDISIQDLHSKLSETYDFGSFKHVWTRGNTFDPIFMDGIFDQFGQPDIHAFWKIRDSRSWLDGMLHGTPLDNRFMPQDLDIDFIHHDAAHDISLDVMRIQTVIKALS